MISDQTFFSSFSSPCFSQMHPFQLQMSDHAIPTDTTTQLYTLFEMDLKQYILHDFSPVVPGWQSYTLALAGFYTYYRPRPIAHTSQCAFYFLITFPFLSFKENKQQHQQKPNETNSTYTPVKHQFLKVFSSTPHQIFKIFIYYT